MLRQGVGGKGVPTVGLYYRFVIVWKCEGGMETRGVKVARAGGSARVLPARVKTNNGFPRTPPGQIVTRVIDVRRGGGTRGEGDLVF